MKSANLQRLHTCTGHLAALYTICKGRQEGYFLSAGGDGHIVEWSLSDPETGRAIASTDERIFALLALPDGGLVAGNMSGGLHWIFPGQTERNRDILHHKKGVYDLSLIDGHLYSCGGDGIVSRWDIEDRRCLESLQISYRPLRAMAWNAQRQLLAVGASDASIYLLKLPDFTALRRIEAAHQPSVFSLIWSSDGRYLFSGGRDALLKVWDAEAGFQPIHTAPAHLYTLNHLAWSPDGRMLASASRDKTIKIWDAAGFNLLKVLEPLRDEGHKASVNRLLWLPEGLISASDDHTLRIWGIDA